MQKKTYVKDEPKVEEFTGKLFGGKPKLVIPTWLWDEHVLLIKKAGKKEFGTFLVMKESEDGKTYTAVGYYLPKQRVSGASVDFPIDGSVVDIIKNTTNEEFENMWGCFHLHPWDGKTSMSHVDHGTMWKWVAPVQRGVFLVSSSNGKTDAYLMKKLGGFTVQIPMDVEILKNSPQPKNRPTKEKLEAWFDDQVEIGYVYQGHYGGYGGGYDQWDGYEWKGNKRTDEEIAFDDLVRRIGTKMPMGRDKKHQPCGKTCGTQWCYQFKENIAKDKNNLYKCHLLSEGGDYEQDGLKILSYIEESEVELAIKKAKKNKKLTKKERKKRRNKARKEIKLPLQSRDIRTLRYPCPHCEAEQDIKYGHKCDACGKFIEYDDIPKTKTIPPIKVVSLAKLKSKVWQKRNIAGTRLWEVTSIKPRTVTYKGRQLCAGSPDTLEFEDFLNPYMWSSIGEFDPPILIAEKTLGRNVETLRVGMTVLVIGDELPVEVAMIDTDEVIDDMITQTDLYRKVDVRDSTKRIEVIELRKQVNSLKYKLYSISNAVPDVFRREDMNKKEFWKLEWESTRSLSILCNLWGIPEENISKWADILIMGEESEELRIGEVVPYHMPEEDFDSDEEVVHVPAPKEGVYLKADYQSAKRYHIIETTPIKGTFGTTRFEIVGYALRPELLNKPSLNVEALKNLDNWAYISKHVVYGGKAGYVVGVDEGDLEEGNQYIRLHNDVIRVSDGNVTKPIIF